MGLIVVMKAIGPSDAAPEKVESPTIELGVGGEHNHLMARAR
jgi:hypothetical protein